MTLSEELSWRGLIKDHTFSDLSWLDEPKTFYLGADAGSADSLTIGNLAIFMLADRLLNAGWNTVLLMGGATSMIGDPGGKESERELVSAEQINKNIAGVSAQVKKLFAQKEFTLVNNYDWFKNIGYLEFLRDIGKHYSMTELLQRDYIAERLGDGGAGISYAEFSYNMIQGYDYYHLYKNHDVVLQIGGSDQWGNMLSGVPLIRKKEAVEVHAMSMPLVINKATGKKFGKSEDGAVWLDPKKTTPYTFYQFWINADDIGVLDYLKIYTHLSKEDIEAVMEEHAQVPSARVAQKRLAYEVTVIVHGKEVAESVVHTTDVLFGAGDYKSLSQEDIEMLKTELPFYEIAPNSSLIEVVVHTGLASSNSEARRFLQDSAIYINGSQFSSEKNTLGHEDTLHGYVILRRGKNNTVLVKLQ